MAKQATLIIAKIGDKYRNVCGFEIHDSVLDVLESFVNTISVLQASKNHLCIEHELRWAATFDGNKWSSLEVHEAFPFITTCLATAMWQTYHSTGYSTRLASMQPLRAHGFTDIKWLSSKVPVTIIDVTDLTTLRYCFVRGGKIVKPMGFIEHRPVPYNFVLDLARDEDDQSMFPMTVKDVKESLDLKPVNLSDLESIWPGPWEPSSQESDNVEVAKHPARSGVLTLRSLAMAATIKQLLAADRELDDVECLIEARDLIHDFQRELRRTLYSKPDLASQSQFIGRILELVVGDDDTVDLSPFCLPETQLALILCGSAHRTRDITTLNLSGNQKIGAGFLGQVLAFNVRMKSLFMLDIPQIELGLKLELIKQSNVDNFMDSVLLARPFIYISPSADDTPLFTDPPIIQMGMVVGYGTSSRFRTATDTPRLRNQSGGVDIEELLRGYSVGARPIDKMRYVDTLPFGTVNRPKLAMFLGLCRFLREQLQEGPPFRRGQNYCRDLALSLATSSCEGIDGADEAITIGPISADLYGRKFIYERAGGSRHFPKMIEPGEWTLLMVYDEFAPHVRYAFITATSRERDLDDSIARGQASTENSSSTIMQETSQPFSNIVTANIEEFLATVIPGHTEEARDLRRRVLESEQYAVGRIFGNPCCRDEVESWLRSSDFDESTRLASQQHEENYWGERNPWG